MPAKVFTALIILGSATSIVAQSTAGKSIKEHPEVTRYLRGATPESRQFDFLIGDWDVAATKYNPDGSLLLQYKAKWSAKYLNEGRMVLDDFQSLGPTGKQIGSFVTLRTYSETSHRWEMTGLAALQAAAASEWSGEWKDGEMHIEVIGKDPKGNDIRNRIRFYEIQNSRFSWESRISLDGRKTWILLSVLKATRVLR